MSNLKPFLRWAGGKSWLIKHLNNYLPKEGFNNYHEPFVGGGSVFFHINPEQAFLSDLNPELINAYEQVKNNVEELILRLQVFENNEECYYRVRGTTCSDQIQQAARFIFLNQTSFNGIYRVNLKGVYNVPFGYRSTNFFNPQGLRSASKALLNSTLCTSDFMNTLDNIQENDLVFIDPPYTVAHENNGFIKYNQKIFAWADQERLNSYLQSIILKGANFIMTNAAHESIEQLYNEIGNRTKLQRASLIGGKGATRTSYNEFIYCSKK